MAWKGESRRHSLARMGIKTATGQTKPLHENWNWQYTKIDSPKIIKVKITDSFGNKELKEFKVTEEMHDYLMSLPSYAVEGIVEYSRSTYGYINRYLLGDSVEYLNPYPEYNKKITKENLEKWISGIDLFLKKGKQNKGKIYRGIRFNNEETLENFIETLGDKVHFDEYLSTTTAHNVKGFLRDNNSIRLEIDTDKSVFLDGIAQHGNEEEYLLPRDMIFGVEDIQKTNYGYNIKLKEI